MYLTSIALDAVALGEELCKISQGNRMSQEDSPFLVYTAKVIAAWNKQHQTDNRLGMRASRPPWAYRIHGVSSISGW